MAFRPLKLRQLDEALRGAQALRSRPAPEQGWIRTVREALGMSLRQLAHRANLSKTAVASIERNEATGAVQLDSLARLADAMDCELVYAVVPRGSLREVIEQQASLAAERMVSRVASSMELEAQGTPRAERDRLIEELARRMTQRPSEIWDA
ncbi:MAG: mobile mystery protein A [Longimicrobiales bacterium]